MTPNANEAIERARLVGGLTQFVVGRVVYIAAHPDANFGEETKMTEELFALDAVVRGAMADVLSMCELGHVEEWGAPWSVSAPKDGLDLKLLVSPGPQLDRGLGVLAKFCSAKVVAGSGASVVVELSIEGSRLRSKLGLLNSDDQ